MLATLGGALALMLGLTVLLLPVLASELSRPRDSLWGGVVLLLGLVLVTSAERLRGAPMLAVLCGGLLVGRLGLEVGQARWRQLTPEEQQRLWSTERWQKSLAELGASLARLLELAGGLGAGVLGWMRQMRQPRQTTKRWVRLETGPSQPDQAAEPPQEQPEGVDQVSEVPAANLAAERPERADAAAVEGATEAVGGTQQAEAAPSEEEAEKAETSGPGAACTPEVVQDAEDSAPAAAAEASDPPADVVVVDGLDGVEDLLQELEGPPDAAPAESPEDPQTSPRPPADPPLAPGETG
ncbi:Ycf66 family protein [Cyanobium sp. LEGE 06113]|uniref:Ycf66 family protein n=1 Tax=Cyanobium sp. LEGE 06113 TaxID=1297573 RepID=UPI00187FA590|nr:Ycf66 family protein [Cyanobium sp. LEGE 06113]MBE9155107.1 hypothetical protein [Cyanobium sp. LEGE 06113]